MVACPAEPAGPPFAWLVDLVASLAGQGTAAKAELLRAALADVGDEVVPVVFRLLSVDRGGGLCPQLLLSAVSAGGVAAPSALPEDVAAWAAAALFPRRVPDSEKGPLSLQEVARMVHRLRQIATDDGESPSVNGSHQVLSNAMQTSPAVIAVAEALAAGLPRVQSEAELRCLLHLALNTLRLRLGHHIMLLALHPQGRDLLRQAASFDQAVQRALELRRAERQARGAPPTGPRQQPRTVGYVSPDLAENELLPYLEADGVDWTQDHTPNAALALRTCYLGCRGCPAEAHALNEEGVAMLRQALDLTESSP
eukprot:EG_transcript_20066